jgi:galactose-1-phosphate uridylyltransferase
MYISDKDSTSISNIVDIEKDEGNRLIYYTDNFIIYVAIKKA